MAWPEKLPSGKWRGVYRDAKGGRRSAPGGPFPHKAAAVRAAAAAEAAARRRIDGDPDGARRTWGQWVEEWWPSRGVEASTLQADEGRRRNHLEPRWGDVKLGAIRRQDVRAWAADLGRQGLAPGTVLQCVALLSGSLSAAVDAEILTANVVAGLTKSLPQPPPGQERFLAREEYVAIRDQLPTRRDQLVADVLVSTGLRWGEMAGLHRWRVDHDRGRLMVVEAWAETAGTIKAYPKGRRAREVPVPGWLLDDLDELTPEATAKTCGLTHTGGRCRSQLLLTTESGTVLRNSNWAGAVWGPSVKAAGVGQVRIHDLRHTYASWLLQDGVPLAEVGQLLGHVSPVTTQRYAWLSREPSAAVLRAVGRGFAPRVPHERAEGCRPWVRFRRSEG
jgi:integrase